MYTIVGLGNPGSKYQNNRHNVGFQFIDYLIENLQILNPKSQIPNIKAIKTNVFMNQSGSFVKKITMNHELSTMNLIIVHDDLDIPLGKFKIQKGQGPRLHNGINSIEQELGTADFWRIRIGVDNRQPEQWTNGEAYVLHDFLSSERNLLHNDIFSKILSRLQTTVLKIDNRVSV